jgi:hypothetical protein
MPVVLRVRVVPRAAQSQAGRLLRVLLVRLGAVPSEAGGGFLLRPAQALNPKSSRIALPG